MRNRLSVFDRSVEEGSSFEMRLAQKQAISVERVTQLAMMAGCVTVLLAVVAGLLPLFDWGPRVRVVGWLLIVAGLVELAFGVGCADKARLTAVVSGLGTTIVGLLFVLNPLAPYLSVANLVMIWLLLRGSWVLLRSWKARDVTSRWLAISGATDVFLGLLLASGLPVALLVVALFGPTPLIVAKFSLILAASLLVTGISELVVASRAGRSPATII